MKIKKIITILFLCLFSIQFNVTSCSSSTDSDENDDLKASVKEPTNNYQVVVEVISIGGFVGCTAATIALQNNPVNDAEFIINNVTLTNDTTDIFSNLYADTLFELSYFAGTDYTLNVFHLGEKIASGTAKMPTTPIFTNLSSSKQQDLNKSMKVT